MKILLVQPGSDKSYKNFEAVPPMGLISVYSALPEDVKRETYFLDGNLVSTDYIRTWIEENKPIVVGITTLTFNYKNAVCIGDAAKNNGSIVVIGGRHATDIRENILREMKAGNRPFDYLVAGEGENVFKDLVLACMHGNRPKGAGRLFSKEVSGLSHELVERRFGFDTDFPVLDYSLLVNESSPEEYMKKLERIGVLKNVLVSMPIISQRGCAYLGEKVHCKFCSIPSVNPKIPYETFELSLKNLINQTHADHVWITDGDFTANRNHVSKVGESINRVKAKTGKDFAIYCFARADELLRRDIISNLWDAGVRSVFIGYEHGSNELLKKMHKNTTKEQNLEATHLLAKHGIEVICAGIVLGTPAETIGTLDEALIFAEELSQTGNVRSIFATPIYPLPGSPYWLEFLDALEKADPNLSKAIRNSDMLQEDMLIEQFQRVGYLMPGCASRYERPSLDKILQTTTRISQLLGKGIQFME